MSELNCAAYRDDLLWYAAGQLSGARRAAIAEHLATCADCRAEVAQWRNVATAIHRDATTAAAPPTTSQATWANIQAHLPPQPQLNGSAPIRGVIHMEFENDAQRVTPIKTRQSEQQSTPRHTRWLAAVATVLVVVLGIAVFGVLHGRTTSSSPGTRIGSALPAGPQLPINAHERINDAVALNDNDAWAVGNSIVNLSQTTTYDSTALLLHYTDGDWHDAGDHAFPHAILLSISMISSSEGWVAGVMATSAKASPTNTTPSSNETPLLLHYSNGQWNKVTLPALQGEFSDLQMVSANEGFASGRTPTQQPLLLHYLNGTWRQDIPVVPSNDGVESLAYSMSPTGDLWATDTTHIWHYQQGHWQIAWPSTSRTNIHLSNIDALGSHDVWVFVKDASTSPQGHFLHFDGTKWTSVTPQGTTLIEAGFLGHSSWLISYLGSGNGRTALHLENGQWKVVAVPDSFFDAHDITATESWSVSIDNQVIRIIHYQNGVWS